MTVIEALDQIIRRRQAEGVTAAWLSAANRAVLGKRVAVSNRAVPPPEAQSRKPAPPVTPAPPVLTVPPEAEVPGSPAAPDSATVAERPNMTGMTWEELVTQCRQCQACPLGGTRRNIVIEAGCRHAPLMFIGEGPGADEDAQGVPFVGRAGQLLTKMIAAIGRDRQSDDPAHAVYIANVVKCRPPRNRVPLPDEAAACIGYLQRQIELVRPKVIVLLGASALKYLCNKQSIVRWRGNWIDYAGIPVMPTFHPAYVLRFESFPEQLITVKRQVWNDLKMVMVRLKSIEEGAR